MNRRNVADLLSNLRTIQSPVEPRFDEPLYNEVLVFFALVIVKNMEINIDAMKPRYTCSEHVVPISFVNNFVKQSPIGKKFDETNDCQCKYTFCQLVLYLLASCRRF